MGGGVTRKDICSGNPLAWPACTVERFLSWVLSLVKGRTRPQGQLVRPPLLASFTLKALRGWPGCRASTRSLSPLAGTGVWAHGAQIPRMGGEVFWEHRSAVRFLLWIARPV